MTIRLSKPILAVFVLTVLSVGSFVYLSSAEEFRVPKRNPHWGKAVSGLSCSIRTDKTAYEPDEDILIDFLLRSEIKVPTTVIRPWILMSFLGTALPLEITGPKGPCKYTGPVLTPPIPPGKSAYVELTGGDIIGASSFFDDPVRIVPKYWSMQRPGEYTIRFRFIRKRNQYWGHKQRKMVPITAWKGVLTSNAVTIRVMEKKRRSR